ncbi:MAG: hypothetical protein QMD71_00815 [bacterium]|nr:hypothetical protein [bacterium]
MIKLAESDNYDAVFGSRLMGRENLSYWELIKERPEYLATIISTFLINKWYNYNFTDIIGAKLYRTSSVRKMRFDTYGVGFDFEFVSKMCKSGFKIGELPIGYKPRLQKEGKKIKPYHMLHALVALFRVKFFT